MVTIVGAPSFSGLLVLDSLVAGEREAGLGTTQAVGG